MNQKSLKLVQASMFAALSCVATMCIHIPTPGTGGYIHPGDAFVILAGIMLGPFYGGLAAGIGSALADMLFGYYIYVPATFLIKCVMAVVSAILFERLAKSNLKHTFICGLCGLISAIIMVCGYLGFELLLYGKGAIVSVPANMIQGIAGIAFSVLLYPLFYRTMKIVKVSE